MNRIALLLAVAVAASLVSGCIMASSREVVRHESATPAGAPVLCDKPFSNPFVGQGDVLMVEGKFEDALAKYVSAAKTEPALACNPAFQRRTNRARAAMACREGDALAEAGQWDKAVLKYMDARGYDKDYGPTDVKFDLARKQAAAVHVGRVGTIIRRDENGAISPAMTAASIAELRMALNYDPENAEAQMMLDALAGHFAPQDNPGPLPAVPPLP